MIKKRKSKIIRWIIPSVIVIAVAAIGVYLMKPEPINYESVNAEIGDITTYHSFSGNIETENRQKVISDKSIEIYDIRVKEGDIVKEGNTLIKTTTGTKLKAKIDGEVASIDVEEDDQVMSGVQLIEIVDYDNLQINVKVDEYDIDSIEIGKEAIIKINALNKEIIGKISEISKEGEIKNGVTFFTATIDLEKDESLKIGMSADVKLISDTATGVITLPMTAIQFDDDNTPYVLKKGEDESPIKTEITTGIYDATLIEIKSGVVDGETILYTKINDTSDSGTQAPGNGPFRGAGENNG